MVLGHCFIFVYFCLFLDFFGFFWIFLDFFMSLIMSYFCHNWVDGYFICYIISYKQIFLLQMKPVHNLSFSCDENRVDYHYVPQHYFIPTPIADGLNICQIYERSLSSSFLPMPHLPLSINSSISFDYEMSKQLKSNSQQNGSKESLKVACLAENNTKIQFEGSSFVELGLEYLVPNKKMSTKNVLRNFGNAQSQYILHNVSVQKQLTETLENKSQFQAWIRKLKLLNFSDYKAIWTISENDSAKQKHFKKMYKKYCWNFYQEECLPYIFNSRLTNQNKKSHLLQVHKMLSGIVNPHKFEGFKL